MEVTENKLKFLRLKLRNEREFIRGYYKLSKQQIRYLFSDILHKPYNKCHLKDLNYDEICICFNVLRAMVLASVKNLVQSLNGIVWVESQILKNTSFNIIIPSN